ncbi:hypothetical protein O3W44_00830 [Pantoea sp. LMR881]|nr:hypothetical protein [Pantoea sp. LMR881]MCZ4057931.1 hypothetical protein [Pantoea sp. LMR881]
MSVAAPSLRFDEKFDSQLSAPVQSKAEIESLLDAIFNGGSE